MRQSFLLIIILIAIVGVCRAQDSSKTWYIGKVAITPKVEVFESSEACIGLYMDKNSIVKAEDFVLVKIWEIGTHKAVRLYKKYLGSRYERGGKAVEKERYILITENKNAFIINRVRAL